jgi:hypothetical protein
MVMGGHDRVNRKDPLSEPAQPIPRARGVELASASLEAVLAQLRVDRETGLRRAEVERRLRQEGPNEVPEPTAHPVRRFLGKFWGLSAWMLELILLLSWVLHKYVDLAIVSGLLLVNAVVSVLQEGRASRAVEALRARLRVMARVRRDGAWQPAPARELVPGDLVRLRAMSVRRSLIALDGSAVAAHALEVGLTLAQGQLRIHDLDEGDLGGQALSRRGPASRPRRRWRRRNERDRPCSTQELPRRRGAGDPGRGRRGGQARRRSHRRGPGVDGRAHRAGDPRTIRGGARRPRQHGGGGRAACALSGGRGPRRSGCPVIERPGASREVQVALRRSCRSRRVPGRRRLWALPYSRRPTRREWTCAKIAPSGMATARHHATI